MRAVVVIALPLTLACTGRGGFDELVLLPEADVDTSCGAACAPPCGTLASLRDDFDDGVTGEQWLHSATDASLLETGGGLELRPTSSTGSAGYVSDEAFTPQGTLAIEIREMFDTTTDAGFNFYLVRYAGGIISMRQLHGTLISEVVPTGGAYQLLASVPYDPIAHRWWRFSLAGQSLSTETSSDGVTWAVLGSTTVPFTLDLVHAGLAIDANGVDAPGRVVVDNLNAPGAGSFSNCPIDQLADEFDGNALDGLWEKSFVQNGSTIGVSGGSMVITPATNTGGAGLFATNHYDFRGRSITAVVPQVLSEVFGTEIYFRIVGTGDSSFIVRNNAIQAFLGADLVTDEPYDAALHRCWRFREAEGMLYWEVAGDPCTSFRVMASADPGVSMSSMSIIVFGQAYIPLADPGSLRVDRLSVP